MKILNLLEKNKMEPIKPRNFVAKNAMKTTSGAGAHRDKKKEQKQGYEKHKGKGVSEGTEQVYKVIAVTKSNALSKPKKLNVKAGSVDEVFERLAASDWYPLEINGVEVVDGRRLKPGVSEGTVDTEKQILTRIRQIMYDRKLSGTDSNAGELLRLKQKLKDIRNKQGVAEATGNPGMPHDFTAVQPGAEVWYKGRFAGWTTGKVYDDPYGKHGKMVSFDPNPSEFPGDKGRVLSLPYDEVSLRKSTSIGKLKGPGQGVAEGKEAATEDVLSTMKKKLGDYLQDVDEGIGGTIAGGIGQFIGNKIDPLAGEIMRAHGEIAGRKAEYTIRKYMHLLQKALKQQLGSSSKNNENMREASDFGEPREILEDVLRTLEREVEWPLTDVMDPREVKQLLAPIVKAVNDKMMSMEEGRRDYGYDSYGNSLRPGDDEGNTEPPNNFAIYINGKKWKVFQGKGQYADDQYEMQQFRQLQAMAARKSQETGKKWEVARTGEAPTA